MPVTSRPRTRLEPISMRSRRIRSGMIGLAMRASSARKAPSSASEAPPTPSVRAESSPYSLDLTIANAPSIVASVIRIEPSTSTPPARPMPSFSSISAEPSSERDRADRHVDEEDPVPVSDCVSAPPASRPIEPPPAETNAYMPIALACSPVSGNSVTMIARITLEATAPPIPWSRRAPISIPWLSASPHRTDAAVNRTRPVRNTFLRPDQVAEPAGQQQEAAEGDQVAVDHPREVRLGEVQVALDRGQRDVHDRRVEDHHQLAEAEHGERDPAPALALLAGSIGRLAVARRASERSADGVRGGGAHVCSFQVGGENTIAWIIHDYKDDLYEIYDR